MEIEGEIEPKSTGEIEEKPKEPEPAEKKFDASRLQELRKRVDAMKPKQVSLAVEKLEENKKDAKTLNEKM